MKHVLFAIYTGHGCGLMSGNTAIMLAVVAAIAPTSFVMANEPGLSAQEVVRRYSKTVACQIYDPQPGYQQFATVQLEPGNGNDRFGAVWLVGWSGDLGCMGGNGTQSLQMNLVMQNGFSPRTVSPVIIDAKPMPDLVGNTLRSLSYKNGVVTISAIAGRQSVGNLKDVTVRYRWLGAWGSQPRFKRLP